ncbi:HDOD domain-containing protein [Lebetimonas sp. JS032]|uniref:HDOD domain-containing protein n=1 Tax=Lebetimonas sp. JS032 TaxID=990070 RepID=UPI0004651D5E|nr:HDOD domain-containing protein [Lebetimonas sp. JS032]
MLISKNDIEKYLQNIPPIPKYALECLNALKEGNIKKAANDAQKDLVLKKQIEKIVNSAAFSLRKEVKDTLQLFTLLGIENIRAIVYSYLVSLLMPKNWEIFKIDFTDFQKEFLNSYKEFVSLEFGETIYKKYAEIGAIIPASVCVCDSLLGEKKEKLNIILNSAPLEYGTLLKRLTGESLFGIAAKIAEIWDLEKEKCEIIKKSECEICDNPFSALNHFIFFYLTSKPAFFDLNSLIEFNPKCVDYIPKTYERISNDSKRFAKESGISV